MYLLVFVSLKKVHLIFLIYIVFTVYPRKQFFTAIRDTLYKAIESDEVNVRLLSSMQYRTVAIKVDEDSRRESNREINRARRSDRVGRAVSRAKAVCRIDHELFDTGQWVVLEESGNSTRHS